MNYAESNPQNFNPRTITGDWTPAHQALEDRLREERIWKGINMTAHELQSYGLNDNGRPVVKLRYNGYKIKQVLDYPSRTPIIVLDNGARFQLGDPNGPFNKKFTIIYLSDFADEKPECPKYSQCSFVDFFRPSINSACIESAKSYIKNETMNKLLYLRKIDYDDWYRNGSSSSKNQLEYPPQPKSVAEKAAEEKAAAAAKATAEAKAAAEAKAVEEAQKAALAAKEEADKAALEATAAAEAKAAADAKAAEEAKAAAEEKASAARKAAAEKAAAEARAAAEEKAAADAKAAEEAKAAQEANAAVEKAKQEAEKARVAQAEMEAAAKASAEEKIRERQAQMKSDREKDPILDYRGKQYKFDIYDDDETIIKSANEVLQIPSAFDKSFYEKEVFKPKIKLTRDAVKKEIGEDEYQKNANAAKAAREAANASLSQSSNTGPKNTFSKTMNIDYLESLESLGGARRKSKKVKKNSNIRKSKKVKKSRKQRKSIKNRKTKHSKK